MKFIKFFLYITLFLNSSIQAASVKETILISTAGGAMCKMYAEKVGGDVEAFSNLNIQSMKVAESMGYTNNLESFISEVNEIKRLLQEQLLKIHGSELNVYNNWCIRFYNGYQKGVQKANQ